MIIYLILFLFSIICFYDLFFIYCLFLQSLLEGNATQFDITSFSLFFTCCLLYIFLWLYRFAFLLLYLLIVRQIDMKILNNLLCLINRWLNSGSNQIRYQILLIILYFLCLVNSFLFDKYLFILYFRMLYNRFFFFNLFLMDLKLLDFLLKNNLIPVLFLI